MDWQVVLTMFFNARFAEIRLAKRPKIGKAYTYSAVDKGWAAFTEIHDSPLADSGPHAEEFKVFWEGVKAKVCSLGTCKAV